jgi:sortase A
LTWGKWVFTVEIPRIGLVARVHEGQSPSVLARGPGHLSGSAMPGPSGNVVIPGHRTVAPHPFLDIDRLEGGDKIVLVAGDARFVYEVTGTAIVSPEDGSVADQTSDPTITLYACHPKGSNRERYVVVGRLVQALPAAQAQASQSSQPGRTDQPKPAPSCGLVPCLARGTRE